MNIKEYSLVAILDSNKTNFLMCKRISHPFVGKLNFVGGKLEDETLINCAYRELFEETGIDNNSVKLNYLFDDTGFYEDGQAWKIHIFYGILCKDVNLIEEKHPLVWVPISNNDFYSECYADSVGMVVDAIKEKL